MFVNCSESRSEVEKKNENFRFEIRKRQIDQYKEMCRKKYIYFKDKDNYELLKNININQTVKQFRNDYSNEKLINEMFLYASSKQSDYLYVNFDDGILSMLMDQLHVENLTMNERKILHILTNFTVYHEEAEYPQPFIDKLIEILRNNTDKGEVVENIIYIFSNFFEDKPHVVMSFINKSERVQLLIKTFESFAEKASTKFAVYKHQIEYFCFLFENIYNHIFYEALAPKQQGKIFSILIKILSITPYKNEKILYHAIMSFQKIFGNSLDENPYLVLKYKKVIRQVANWFSSYLQKVVNKSLPTSSYYVVQEYLKFLKIIYGVNINEELEEIENFYTHLFHNHVEIICDDIFFLQEDALVHYLLDFLANPLLEVAISETLVDKNFKIFTNILYYCQCQRYSQSKSALICLCNVIRTVVDGFSEQKPKLLQILQNHSIAELFANNIWKFVDNQLNTSLLEGLEVMLGNEIEQFKHFEVENEELPFWSQFTSLEGKKQIQKLIKQTQSEELRALGIKILDSVEGVLNR